MLAVSRRKIPNDVLGSLVLPEFLDVGADDFPDLNLHVEWEVGQARLCSQVGEVCTFHHDIDVDEPRDIHKYHVVLCRIKGLKEIDGRKIMLQSTGDRLGFCFPLVALRSGIGIQSPWECRFADVGFRTLTSLEMLHKHSHLRSVTSLRSDRGFYLDEVYSDSCAMFVFSNDAMVKAALTPEILEVMLLERGINVLRGFETYDISASGFTETINLGLRIPCGEAREDCDVLLSVIRRGDVDIASAGAFLHYYQIFEFCIDLIFDREIQKLLGSGHDTWKLKEKLGEVASEKKRISLLNSQYLGADVRRDAFDDLKSECIAFLKDTDTGIDLESDWHVWLYKVRNIVIHSQIKLHKQAGHMELERLNEALRRACFEVLLNFQVPGVTDVIRPVEVPAAIADDETELAPRKSSFETLRDWCRNVLGGKE